MEFASIERELYIDASPEIVFEVVSRPEHVSQWWPDEASYSVSPGAVGKISFGDAGPDRKTETLTVVDVRPPSSFSFRWIHPTDEAAREGNSLLVTFELSPSGSGTLLKFTETGFREMGWEAAVLEETYNDHTNGWNFFLPRLAPYAATVGARP